MTSFLEHLKDISTSPLAFAGYIFVAALWTYRYWVYKNPKSKIKEIISSFSSDLEKNTAIKSIIGIEPPRNLKGSEILKWYVINNRHKSRGLLLLAYISTLVTVIIIVGLSFYKTKTEEPKGPVIIEQRVHKNF